MARYKDLKDYPRDPDYPEDSTWIATRLLDLRRALAGNIVEGRRPGSLIVGSWNIRAFDGGRPRLTESMHYIAEIIDHFDICAIQEVQSDLRPLQRLIWLLGPNWDYFVTDINTQDGGNNERLAFVYNRNRVWFRNLIGEIAVDTSQSVFPRSPFFAAFQAGWFKFVLCTTHIRFGDTSSASLDKRAQELGEIARTLAARATREEQAYLLLGDMNITRRDDVVMQALEQGGFTAPDFGPTNLDGDNHFDHIAFADPANRTHILRAKKFDWRSAVYRAEDAGRYAPIAAKQRGKDQEDFSDPSRYRSWMTWEMSDHLPIWIELMVDFSDDYLRRYT